MPELDRVLLEPFQFAFMQRALAATVIVGVLCAVVGAFVVTKGLGFIGDGVAHASLLGVAVAYTLGQNIYLGAAITAVATALSINFLSQRARLSMDTAIGVIFAFAFSLGVVIMSRVRNYTVDLFSFVFGNVLGVGVDDLVLIGAAGLLVVGLIALLYKELFFVAFDPVMAEASGLPVARLQYLLLALLGVTVVVAMKAIGIVLVVAMLITPAATATLLTRRFHQIMLVGAGLSAVASVLGLYLSFYANVASGGAIVVMSTAIFLVVLVSTELSARRARPA
ncbi:MAG: metal ABC transporter permease [Chloroflexi bacterium]|nr:metal ABC transporter permease [Chloroflexota bacterium]